MGFSRTIRRGKWSAVGLLGVVATVSACTVTTVPLPRPDTSPSTTPPTEMRPLSSSEKAALGKALSQTVLISKGPRGEYIKGLIEHIGGSAVASTNGGTE